MGKCCSKASEPAPKEPFEVVTEPPAALGANPMTNSKASQTAPASAAAAAAPVAAKQKSNRKAKGRPATPAPRPTLMLPDVPATPPRQQVTPESPWEMTDGV